jgi:hypothetical protein
VKAYYNRFTAIQKKRNGINLFHITDGDIQNLKKVGADKRERERERK